MDARSRTLLAVTVVAVLSAGCLSDALPSGDDESTPTLTPAEVPTPTPTATPTPTPTAVDWQIASDMPDANKSVYLENRWDRNVTMAVEVVRNATGETVHADRYEVAPDERQRVYRLTEADPDGIELFTTIVSARNATSTVAIETNECYGSAYAQINPDGELETYYAIC